MDFSVTFIERHAFCPVWQLNILNTDVIVHVAEVEKVFIPKKHRHVTSLLVPWNGDCLLFSKTPLTTHELRSILGDDCDTLNRLNSVMFSPESSEMTILFDETSTKLTNVDKSLAKKKRFDLDTDDEFERPAIPNMPNLGKCLMDTIEIPPEYGLISLQRDCDMSFITLFQN